MATGRVPTTANSPLTAKGDLFTYSTGSAKLAVGNDGETLVADSSTSTGLRYQGSMAAGKNAIINGGMDIWQRGTSFAIAASTAASASTYTADRWQTKTQANQAIVVSRQATGDTTNLPFIQYAMRVQRNAGQTGTGDLDMIQNMETVNSIPFAGKTVTFSFYARKGADYSAASSGLVARIFTGTGTDQNIYSGYTGTVTTTVGTATLTTSWQRFSYSTTIGATATQIALDFFFSPVGTAGTNDYYEVTGVQLEVGSVATAFARAQGTIQGELAACQRYFAALPSGSASDNYATFATGYTASSTKGNFVVNLPVPMRIYPTMTYSAGNTFATHTGASTVTAGTAIATDRSSPNTIWCNLTVASGLTAGNALFLIGNNTTSAKIEASAEL